MIRMIALVAALLPFQALAEVPLRLNFAYLDAPDTVALAAPEVTVTDILGGQPLAVTMVAPEGAGPDQQAVVTLPDAVFSGPYARLRVAVTGLRLPPADSQSGDPMSFAFELVLRRAGLPEAIDIDVPVVISSRRGAIKPFLDAPEVAEDMPDRFFMALQWMSVYRADAAAVAQSPRSFALHRLISLAIVDFAIRMAKGAPGPVLIIPATELNETLRLYWDSDPEGRAIHLRAYSDARTILWHDLSQTEQILRDARRAGVNAPALCNEARSILAFFKTHQPPEDEVAKVDSLFPNPGSLARYIEGRELDLLVSCTRLSV
jgi:hypothetical protein